MENPEHPLVLKVFYSYLLSLACSLLSISLFSRVYGFIFNPPLYRSGLFYDRGHELIIGGFILALAFFIPLFIFLIVPRKKWLAWLFAAIIPFLMFLQQGYKEVLWFVILTILGSLIGWLIKLAYKKFKK